MTQSVAFLFDLDGTLVDSVYNHVRAWHLAFREQGFDISVWRIHRKIGMSGGLFTAQLQRELGRPIDEQALQKLRDRHAALFRELSRDVPPLPGAVELLRELTRQKLPWAIATSGRMRTAATNLKSLGVDPEQAVVITRDMVRYAKPDPDLFVEAARRLGADTRGSYVIGDSIWDMYAASRCGALGIGLLSGGYGKDELERAGAMRVFDDPADMLEHLDELARTAD
ncbi:MAG TPA: HAD family hydrolase [Sphingomicrobium sp.]|nr:HAD family hydrolase [Sphingomicrobium sp.]